MLYSDKDTDKIFSGEYNVEVVMRFLEITSLYFAAADAGTKEINQRSSFRCSDSDFTLLSPAYTNFLDGGNSLAKT
jgi:hypothetical protein